MTEAIIFENSWQNTVPILAVVLSEGTHQGQAMAREELQRMAWFADHFGQVPMIEVYAMAAETIAAPGKDADYYDILVRFEGDDPFAEFEGIVDYGEVTKKLESLQKQFPAAEVVEVGG